MKKPVKAGATVRVEAAKARKAARLAKARRAGRTAMASRTAQSTLAAAIGAGILLQGGPASPPSVEMVVRTVAIAGPADVVDEPESSADESASGEAGGHRDRGHRLRGHLGGDGVRRLRGERHRSRRDRVRRERLGRRPGGPGRLLRRDDDDAERGAGADDGARVAAGTGGRPRTGPRAVAAARHARHDDGDPTAATPPSGAPTTSATPTSTVVAASGAAARPAGDRTAATPTARATHSATQNLFTRIALALAGLAPHDAHVPGGPATPTSALLIAQWAFFRRGENPLFNQSPVASPTQSAQTTTGEITGDLNASDPDRDRLTYALTDGAPATARSSSTTTAPTPTSRTRRRRRPVAPTRSPSRSATTTRPRPGWAASPRSPGMSSPGPTRRWPSGSSARTPWPSRWTSSVTGTTAPPIPADVTVGTPDQATGVVRGTLPATDASGAPLTYTVTTPPAYGRVTIRPDGSYVYVPSAAGQAYARTHPGAFDTFTVQASSGATARFAARVAPGDELTVPVPLAQSAAQRAPDRHDAAPGWAAYPGSALMSPGGRYVAVPSYQDRTVTIVDTTNGTSFRRRPGCRPQRGGVQPGRRTGVRAGPGRPDHRRRHRRRATSSGPWTSGTRARLSGSRRTGATSTSRDAPVRSASRRPLTLMVIDTTDSLRTALAEGGFYNGVEFSAGRPSRVRRRPPERCPSSSSTRRPAPCSTRSRRATGPRG